MMAESLSIRRVSVEFLRPGPAHNQLLSPYTQYLAVCNDAGAALVSVPYEHRVFERRLKELRYETGDSSDRVNMLHEIGRDIGRMLEAVPGFTGALSNASSAPSTLVHLRLTLSAAELALLPFELAEVPVGSSGFAVAIQTRPPVSVTRHIRTVSSEGLSWPDRPRILFASGNPALVPFEAHRQALLDAIAAFRYPSRDDLRVSQDGRREDYGDLLTILVDPTLTDLHGACEAIAYTHIHILTHGDLDMLSNESFGIVLRGEQGNPDVVGGDRFVRAITRVGHQPSMVTIASCDSGNVGSVIVPGASFAHAVHHAGIPFVVGSQFPLSKDGSVPLTARLYSGVLWGRHPLLILQEARAELHTRYYTEWHDWASVVVYEALPTDLEDQLDMLRYSQARRAMNAALQRVDLAVATHQITNDTQLRALNHAVSHAMAKLPLDGQFAVECIGLQASSRKRLAQAASQLADHSTLGDPYDLLEQARLDYTRAARGLLVNDVSAVQRKATLHWILVQLVSLSRALEHGLAAGEAEAASLCAEHYREHWSLEERAWAHASLAELWLLRLTEPGLSDDRRKQCRAEALKHTNELSRFYPGVDEFPITSTRRQFQRYVDWWGSVTFEAGLARHGRQRRQSWTTTDGVCDTARDLVKALERARPPHTPPGATEPPPSSGARCETGPGGGGELTRTTALPDRPLARQSTPERGTLSTLRPAGGPPFFTVEALPAGHGDCLWIEYGEGSKTHRVLIDCGTESTGRALLERVEGLPASERFLELFVLSHIDSDHIGGALPFFRAFKNGLRVGDVWFNGWKHVSGQLGARQGEIFSTAIQDFELPWNVWCDGQSIVVHDGELPVHELPGGMKLTLLSPTRRQLDRLRPIWTRELKRYGLAPGGRVDYSRFLRGIPSTIADAADLADIDGMADAKFGGDSGAPNGTSIALLAEFGGASAVLAADAHAPVLVDSIRKLLQNRNATRLKVDLFKVSHHGSQNNVSSELVQLLDCSRYLVSTNGDHFFHPDRQAVARLLKYGGETKTLYFNYKNRFNEVWGDKLLDDVRRTFNCTTVYPAPGESGMAVSLL
jgi:beta-lactamase superfamily II metal-dependent hydrolase